MWEEEDWLLALRISASLFLNTNTCCRVTYIVSLGVESLASGVRLELDPSLQTIHYTYQNGP